MSIDETVGIIEQLETYRRTHKLEFYDPYEFQKNFHHAKGLGNFVPVGSDLSKEHLAVIRFLQCANQIGKSTGGGFESGMHLTGLYPDWWKGHRFNKPTEGMASSNTNETTRDRCQRELFGDPADKDAFGTGSIPLELIGSTTRKAGVPDALEVVLVKHISGGWSKLYLKPYEQGYKKFMGYRLNFFWDDEEPPPDVFSQQKRSTLATDGIGYVTYTPEEGVTEVVYQAMQNLQIGEALITATWDDAPHMTMERREQSLKKFPIHEQEMRSRGIPLMGSGLVWPVNEDQIRIEPIQIPSHWAKINGIDFGYDHPAALACMAWDRDTDIIYVYDVWSQSHALTEVHVQAIKSRGDWIPVAWPHDGMQNDPKSGKPMADIYRNMGVNMHREPFTNPASPGQKEGQGGNGLEVGVQEILSRMETGRFKVFTTCEPWFIEWRMYHRKNGEIVKLKDDLMSATRYGVMMRRFATTKPVRSKQSNDYYSGSLRNW